MLKITDPKYSLPQIEALAYVKTFESGTTNPIAVNGVNRESGLKGQYVVKLINSDRMTEQRSIRELLGSWIALELEIPVIEPVIVHISEEFAKTTLGKSSYQSIIKSIGLNFGSVFEAGYDIITRQNNILEPPLLDQAKKIFMFDMLISNSDRGAGKPNVLTNGKKLLILDHELAFSFVDILSILRNKEPWKLGPHEEGMYKKHHFYHLLKDQDIDFEKPVKELTRINERFWERAMELIPIEWDRSEFPDIKEHINSIIAQKNIFSQSLSNILNS